MSLVTKDTLDRIARDRYYFGNKVFKAANEGAALLDLLGSTGDSDDLPAGSKMEGDVGMGEGRRIVVPVDYENSANKAVGFSEQGSLADPGRSKLEWLQFYVAGLSQQLRITNLAQITTKGGKQSLVNGIMYQMKRQIQAAREGLNWHMHRDGSGELAQCGTTSDTNVIQLSSTADMSLLVVGTRVVIRNRTTGALIVAGTTPQAAGIALEITARSVANKTITVATEAGAAVSITTTNAAGVYAFDSQGAHVWGLGIMCDDADPAAHGGTVYYGGLTRSGNDWHKANQLDASDTAVSASTTFSIDLHVRKMLNLLDRVAPEKSDYYVMSGYDNFDAIGAQLERNQITKGGYQKKLDGGYDGLEYQNATFVRDRHAPFTRARFIPKKLFYRYVMRPWGWDDTSGSIWERVNHSVNGRATMTFKAFLISYQQAFSVQDQNWGEWFGLNAAA